MSIPASRRARLLALILALPCLAGVSETMVEEPAGLPEAARSAGLVDIASGEELAMPTDYDDFSERAAADYQALPPAVIANRKVLIDVMTIHGFTVLPSEWWHFDAAGWEQYPLLDIPLR